MEIADTPAAEGAETFRPAGHDMACRNVGFAYDEKEALHGVSFTAKEGEVTALVDPSGLGKRTCVRLAARLWDHSERTSTAGGVDILTVRKKPRRSLSPLPLRRRRDMSASAA